MRTFLLTFLLLFAWSSNALAQDPLVAKALARVAQYEQLEPSLKEGDVKTANEYLQALAWAEKRLAAVGQKGTDEWQAADKRCKALRVKIETKAKGSGPKPKPAPQPTYDYEKLVGLNKEVSNAYNNLKLLSVTHMADEGRVRGVRKEIARLRVSLQAFPAADDNVKLVTANINDLEKLLEAGLAALNKDKGESEAWIQAMETLPAKYDRNALPGVLAEPFTKEQIELWAASMRRLIDIEIPTDLAWLQKARGNAAMDQGKVNSHFHRLQGSTLRQLYEVEKSVRERLASDANEGLRVAQWILETDPTDEDQVLNRVLGRGSFDESMTRLHAGRSAVQMASAYDEAMGSPCVAGPSITEVAAPKPSQPDRVLELQTIERAIAHLKAIALQALDSVRMPAPASTDAALLRAAQETLRKSKSEVGEWKRLVINVDNQVKSQRQAWLRGGTTSATITSYDYKWEQFQVTTAELVNGELWLFANTLKRYESGDPTTTIGQWILTNRFELTRILAENLEKPPLPVPK